MGKVDIAFVASFVIESSIRVPRVPVLGETLLGDFYNLAPGGKGTNQAVTASRQNKEIGLVVKIGNDIYGEMALDLYKKEDIDISGVLKTNDEKTSIGLVYFLPTGKNCIGFYNGSNKLLTYNEVKDKFRKIMPAKIVSAQLESPDEAIKAAFELAEEYNATTILNPAPAREINEEIFEYTSILTPNEIEARILAGYEPDRKIDLTNVGKELIEKFNLETVIITIGEKGSLIIQRGHKPIEIASYKVETEDTLGAGDCFNGSLAVALSEGKSLIEAVKWANVAAALSTKGIGGIAPLPKREEVEEHFYKYKEGGC